MVVVNGQGAQYRYSERKEIIPAGDVPLLHVFLKPIPLLVYEACQRTILRCNLT